MKYILPIVLIALSIATIGCGNKETQAKDKSPSFMFWCFRKEMATTEYHVPDMATQTAASYLQNELKTVLGYENSSIDLDRRTLTVNYRSSTIRSMNFEEAIALAGFSVNNRPGNPKAKIPIGVK